MWGFQSNRRKMTVRKLTVRSEGGELRKSESWIGRSSEQGRMRRKEERNWEERCQQVRSFGNEGAISLTQNLANLLCSNALCRFRTRLTESNAFCEGNALERLMVEKVATESASGKRQRNRIRSRRGALEAQTVPFALDKCHKIGGL